MESSTPPASSANVSRRMRATPQRDTPTEIALRSALHRKGLRFRVHRPVDGVPRVRPDIVFVSARVAVFVDGCFWHACPNHGTLPKENRTWWDEKLRSNVERDLRHNSALRDAGWSVVRVWEHEDPSQAANRTAAIIEAKSERS